MKSEWDADEMDLINADRVDALRDLWSEFRDTRTEVAKLTAKLARSERWRIKNNATLVAENLRLRAVIAEAETYISHDTPTDDEQGHWAAGIRFAYDRIRPILSKATQTESEAGK